MSGPAFMQIYWSDYFGDTRHLSCEQHGAYLQLLGSMWLAGGSLPNDAKKLAKITGCTASRWAKICPEVLAFFSVDGDTLTHKRVMFELKKAHEKSIKRAEAGSLGGRAKSLKNNDTDEANASILPKHLPDTRYQNKNVEDKSSTPLAVQIDPDREAWEQAVPMLKTAHRMGEAQARTFFGRLLSENQLKPRDLLAAIATCRANQTPDPRAYLTKAAQSINRRRSEPRAEKRVAFV
jgi:uncharacterized protein YdaU (DUF1376 family)